MPVGGKYSGGNCQGDSMETTGGYGLAYGGNDPAKVGLIVSLGVAMAVAVSFIIAFAIYYKKYTGEVCPVCAAPNTFIPSPVEQMMGYEMYGNDLYSVQSRTVPPTLTDIQNAQQICQFLPGCQGFHATTDGRIYFKDNYTDTGSMANLGTDISYARSAQTSKLPTNLSSSTSWLLPNQSYIVPNYAYPYTTVPTSGYASGTSSGFSTTGIVTPIGPIVQPFDGTNTAPSTFANRSSGGYF